VLNTPKQTNKDAFTNGGNGPPRTATQIVGRSRQIHDAVMMLTAEERLDRATVNETVRTHMSPLRPVGSADEFGVPTAEQ
jgi:hypothetical protein